MIIHTAEGAVKTDSRRRWRTNRKNIETILAEAGVELTEEQKAAINKAVNENFKSMSDWQKQHDKAENLTEQLNMAKEELKKFDGVDADGLNQQIADLKVQMEAKEKEYNAQLAERDFSELVKEVIGEAGELKKNVLIVLAGNVTTNCLMTSLLQFPIQIIQ